MPTSEAAGSGFLVDIELLSPDRLVRFLNRRLSSGFVDSLASALLGAAQDPLPQHSVPTIEDPEAGLSVLIADSSELEVTVEILVVSSLDADVLENDGVAFDVSRSSLIGIAHALQEWLP